MSEPNYQTRQPAEEEVNAHDVKRVDCVRGTRRIQRLFHLASAYPSQSQVVEMIHCAREHKPAATSTMPPVSPTLSSPLSSSPPSTPGSDADVESPTAEARSFLTFGEFCLYVDEFKSSYERE